MGFQDQVGCIDPAALKDNPASEGNGKDLFVVGAGIHAGQDVHGDRIETVRSSPIDGIMDGFKGCFGALAIVGVITLRGNIDITIKLLMMCIQDIEVDVIDLVVGPVTQINRMISVGVGYRKSVQGHIQVSACILYIYILSRSGTVVVDRATIDGIEGDVPI